MYNVFKNSLNVKYVSYADIELVTLILTIALAPLYQYYFFFKNVLKNVSECEYVPKFFKMKVFWMIESDNILKLCLWEKLQILHILVNFFSTC